MSFSFSGKIEIEAVFRKRRQTLDLLEYANNNRQLFCDVDVNVGSKNIPANKMVLSCASKYFEKLFKTEMKEKYEKSVKVEGVDFNSMKSLIDFIYTGNINISAKNVHDLLSASDYLIVEEVKEFCFEFLHEALSPENCCFIQSIANQYQNIALESQVEEFFVNNFSGVISSIDFKYLSKEDLVSFVLKHKRKELHEDLVYKAILAWTKCQESNRGKDFPELFVLLKCHTIPLSFLKDIISKESLVKSNHTCCKIVMETLCNPRSSSLSQCGTRIISLGGVKTESKVIEVFNSVNESSNTFPDLPEGVAYGDAVTFDQCIFLVGGSNSSSVWKLNLQEETLVWKRMTSMNNSRQYLGCAVFNEFIVACGGYENNKLASSECYLPSWNSWITGNIKDLSYGISGHALVSCKGCLFAIGGMEGRFLLSNLSSVQCFKPDQNSWISVKPMQSPRHLLAAVNCNDFLFVIGGTSSQAMSSTLKSCERYDVDLNEWSFVKEMHFCRSGCSACVLQGKIYVVGGLDKKGTAVKEIECYDPSTDNWNVVGETVEELHGHSLVVL